MTQTQIPLLRVVFRQMQLIDLQINLKLSEEITGQPVLRVIR